MPRTLGRIEDAASKLSQLGESAQQDAPTTALLWVLRRPVDESAATEEP